MTPRNKADSKPLHTFKPDSEVVLVDKYKRRWTVKLEHPSSISTFGVVVVTAPEHYGELVGRKWFGINSELLAVKGKRPTQPDGSNGEEWVADLYPAPPAPPVAPTTAP